MPWWSMASSTRARYSGGGFPQQALVRHVHCHHVVGRKVPQGDARKEILELLRHRVGAEEAHLFPQAHQAPQQGAGGAQGVPVGGGVAHHQNLVPASQQGGGLGAVQHGLFLLAGGGFVPGLFRLQVVEQLGDVGAVLDGIGGLKKQLGHMAQGEALPQLRRMNRRRTLSPARQFWSALSPPWC